MSRIATRTATIAASAGGMLAAFLAFSPTAGAEPAPAPPGMPGMDVVSQLANAPAMASQLLQNAATMLSPTPAPAAAAPAVPPPTATAAINLPQPSAVSAPLTNAVGSVPPAQVNLPGAPSGMPLLNQLPLPGDIASIAQNIPGLGTNAAIPSIPAPMSNGPMTPPPAGPAPGGLPPSLNPFSALP